MTSSRCTPRYGLACLVYTTFLTFYCQAKNMVLNVSETEAKVRDATNDDPW